MYIFKYNQDEQILRNGSYLSTYTEFMTANPEFPLVQGEWFEYGSEKFVRINEHGHDVVAGGSRYQALIQAIEALNG